eukprot:726512-Hanusia_phi.AAC.1
MSGRCGATRRTLSGALLLSTSSSSCFPDPLPHLSLLIFPSSAFPPHLSLLIFRSAASLDVRAVHVKEDEIVKNRASSAWEKLKSEARKQQQPSAQEVKASEKMKLGSLPAPSSPPSCLSSLLLLLLSLLQLLLPVLLIILFLESLRLRS